ncbi:hypothetical protein FVR03_18460 [Pontibacter qinzhouensis]|uniref:Uncharacterized protein n=1 Tax=Pontibacter qinzhouensis TaxID=2603253 RepID=A0A5C8J9T9_9BACT|nr:hypothetical protein [Pontibacter qinzhouensis]TXK33826.1 hypothetical protein FVR03_18460 [Pontibacter qinzhouensis]
MKHHFYIIFLGITTALTFSACERTTTNNRDEVQLETAAEPVEARVEERRPATVQEALQADAQLARTMSLAEFVKHMESRETYYSQFEEVNYEDDFVKIKMEGSELKVETAEGKAKLDDEKGKIKTESETRKWEKKN